MGNKRILLAHRDPGLEQQFRQALGESWQITPARTGPSALDCLKHSEYEVLVAGLDIEEVSGAELLNHVRRKHPSTVRFVVASEDEKGRVMKEVLGAHQFLACPLDVSVLKRTIERAMELDVWISNERMRTLVARVRSFPAVPAIYLELISALRNPNATTEDIGAIISKDMAITTKLLQVTNSAYFGLSSRITDPAQAVGILGFETVKSMVTAIKMLGHYDRVHLADGSIDQLWAHSTDVARSARQIALMHTGDSELAEVAYTAGLLHDVGKLILAANFDQQYRGAQSLSTKQGVPLWEVETEIFGATHGEVGAYLLGLWGLPVDLMEATALHHYPGCGTDRRFSALTAVHVANVLEYEVTSGKQDSPAPKIDMQYLEDIGVADCLDSWRTAVTNRDFSMQEIRTPKIPVASTNPEPVPVVVRSAPSLSEPPERDSDPQPVLPPLVPVHPASASNWRLFASAAAVFVLLLVGTVWHKTSSGRESVRTEKVITVAARQSAPNPSLASNPNPTAKTPARSSQDLATPVVPPNPPVAKAESEAPKVSTPPAAEPEAGPQPAPPVTTVPAPAKPSFPELKLQGIFFSADRPTAIVNGEMVSINDYLRGARVVQIATSNVVFEFAGQRKTLNIK